VALAVIAVMHNVRIIRAHDVAATVDALKMVAAVGLLPRPEAGDIKIGT
jgi:dihydropteroate synthase